MGARRKDPHEGGSGVGFQRDSATCVVRTPAIQQLVHLLSDPREQLLLVFSLFRLCSVQHTVARFNAVQQELTARVRGRWAHLELILHLRLLRRVYPVDVVCPEGLRVCCHGLALVPLLL